MPTHVEYMVTGFPRSGTSMMMAALEAGGLPCFRSAERESLRVAGSDEFYDPNPAGLYEPTLGQLRAGAVPPGAAVKVVAPWLRHLPGLSCARAVLMTRDPEEIRQSYEAFIGRRLPPAWVAGYPGILEAVRSRLADAVITTLSYTAVLADPLGAFRELAAAGWPIDPAAAAAVVDPTQHRFRIERLTVGI